MPTNILLYFHIYSFPKTNYNGIYISGIFGACQYINDYLILYARNISVTFWASEARLDTYKL